MRGYENEPVIIQRDVEAVMVPGGQSITLKLGLAGYITQALGGSFTIYIEGNLYRLPGEQADAIGKEVVRPPQLPPNATEQDVRELAWQQMRSRQGSDTGHQRHDDADRGRMRHGRRPGPGRQGKARHDSNGGKRGGVPDL